jgi:iron complex outermembrane recepter protein
LRVRLLGGGVLAVLASNALAQADITTAQVAAADAALIPERVIVTARLRAEDPQDVPISLSVIEANVLDRTLTYNLSQLTQLVPSLNYTSPNPRNTAFTIRGLGSSVVAIAQANDGLEPGVGFYIDQVYHARPATAAFDFLDIERVEVLRGPQGTLFGKNTTAGTISITTKEPSFDPEYAAEISLANFGYLQGRAAFSGAIVPGVLAARLSFAATRRDGVIENVRTGAHHNDIGTFGARGQILFRRGEDFRFRLSADYSGFESECCTQVFVRVGATLKPASLQYPALAAGIGYAPASTDPYARKTDIDAALMVDTHEGGVSGIADWNAGPFTLTSVSAWRWWDWDAANDRDYTRLSIQTLQHIPSRQIQYSQEFRLASNGVRNFDYLAGLYWFRQTIDGRPITEYGPDAAYWLLGPSSSIPRNLLESYRSDGRTKFTSDSYAAFGELGWHVTQRLIISPGLRYTIEDKHGSFSSTVSGGLATTDPTLVARKLSILRPQSYEASVSDSSASGRINAGYHLTDDIMAYASYARGYKSGGINMSGLPLNPSNLPALSTAVVDPERNSTIELGMKSRLLDGRLLVNADVYDTTVHDFQANVVDTGPGALRGYLANVDEVRVQGVEIDGALTLDENLAAHASAAFTEGRYESYEAGPCPLERIAVSTTVCDLSGRPLPSSPKWALSVGGEYSRPLGFAHLEGELFASFEASWRSKVYGDPSDSQYTVIDGYGLVNVFAGFRRAGPWELVVWVKNLLDADYIQNLTVQAGNSGLVVGTPGEPRLFGLTIRATY